MKNFYLVRSWKNEKRSFSYNQQHFIDRLIVKSKSVPRFVKRSKRIIRPWILKLRVERELTTANSIPSSPFDKIYCHLDSSFPVSIVEKFKNEKKSSRLYAHKRKLFFTSRKFSLVINVGKAQITIWGNNNQSEIQFNGKQVSYKFIREFLNIVYPGEFAKISRMDVSFDVKRSLSFVAENIVFLRKKSRKIFGKTAPKTEMDPKKGFVYKFKPSTEYHGKFKEISIYDSGKKHKLGEEVSRIEIRFKMMRVMPVMYFHQLKKLEGKDTLFDDIRLPLRIDMKDLSSTETKHLSELRKICILRGCSPSLGLAELRIINPSLADSAARALKKSERDHYNFFEAFIVNLEIFLNTPISKCEEEFLAALRTSLSGPLDST
ncbi:MAG: hypothetical protein ACOVP4_04845 [Bacteriovoracaceae bacterium]